MSASTMTVTGATHATAPTLAGAITLCLAKVALTTTHAPMDDAALVVTFTLVTTALSLIVSYLASRGIQLPEQSTVVADTLTQHITVNTPPTVTVSPPTTGGN